MEKFRRLHGWTLNRLLRTGALLAVPVLEPHKRPDGDRVLEGANNPDVDQAVLSSGSGYRFWRMQPEK